MKAVVLLLVLLGASAGLHACESMLQVARVHDALEFRVRGNVVPVRTLLSRYSEYRKSEASPVTVTIAATPDVTAAELNRIERLLTAAGVENVVRGLPASSVAQK